MGYTISASTDDISSTSPNSLAGPSFADLICLTVCPSAITAGRALTGFAGSYNIQVESGGELSFTATCSTTNGIWLTSGLGLTAGVPKFLAILFTMSNTGPTVNVAVWAGNSVTQPVAVSISQTQAPVGSFSTQSWTSAGNSTAAASLGAPGDIEELTVIAFSQTAGATVHPLSIAAYGTIDALCLDVTYNKFVLPIWQGNKADLPMRPAGALLGEGFTSELAMLDSFRCKRTGGSTADGNRVITFNGATPSLSRWGRGAQGVAGFNRRVIRR